MVSDNADNLAFGRDLERVGALVQGFYKYRDNIAKLLPIMAGTSQHLTVSPEVMAAAWVGFSMARIWPETVRVEEGDMPLPNEEQLELLSLEQQQFVAFSFGVLGGISEVRPITDGPLGAIADLVIALAPLVVIPAEELSSQGYVSQEYLSAVAYSLGLSLTEVHKLLTILGMAQN